MSSSSAIVLPRRASKPSLATVPAMSPAMHDDLLDRRADYPILGKQDYLINNSLGAMHGGVHDR